MENTPRRNPIPRGNFLKTSAALGVTAAFAGQSKLFAAGSDKLRVGLIGCGGRGTGAAMNCLDAAENVELVAMADLFEDRLKSSLITLKTSKGTNWSSAKPWTNGKNVKVTEETRYVGWDAADNLIKSDVDLVILACPPHFRPMHLKAAIEAGKHVFAEKPVAVDPVGVRSVIETSKLAREKGLAIVAGTQRRHQANYVEIMRRVHNGDIGELVGGQCYWNWEQMFSSWGQRWDPEKSEMENQIRRWVFYTWLSGDHICEQHVHNLDVINWAFQTHPVTAIGTGGRQRRTGEGTGNVYDHFAVEFEYPNGARILSTCRQMDGTEARVSERVVGTKGSAMLDMSGMGVIDGANAFTYGENPPNPYDQEHVDLINSIRRGNPINEGEQVAISTMTGILGRMSAYTGMQLKWDWVMEKSQLDLSPAKYEFGPNPVDDVAIPGLTKLI